MSDNIVFDAGYNQMAAGAYSQPAQLTFDTSYGNSQLTFDAGYNQQVVAYQGYNNGYGVQGVQQNQIQLAQNNYVALSQAQGMLTADNFVKYTYREHVLIQPGMYVGSIKRDVRGSWVWNVETGTMCYINIDVPLGMERIFLEIVSNAADAVGESRRVNVDPGLINIDVDQFTVCVTNRGVPMPVLFKQDFQEWVPTFVMSNELSGSKFNDGKSKKKHAIGQNGTGAKVTNILSLWLEVEVYDPINRKHFKQIWRNNMSSTDGPQIEDYMGTEASTRVKFQPDFARFGYDPAVGFPPEALPLFNRHAIDLAYNSRVQVSFNNGQPYIMDNLQEFGRLYFSEGVINTATYYLWEPEADVINMKDGVQRSRNNCKVPLVEILFLDTPQRAENLHYVSFVNSLMAREGLHIDNAVTAVAKHLTELVNRILSGAGRPGKGKGKDKKNKHRHDDENAKKKKSHVALTVADVKPYLSVLVSIHMDDPEFDSQTKTRLVTKPPPYHFPDTLFKSVEDWEIVQRLYLIYKMKQKTKLSKMDGKKRRFINLKHLEDANDAGTDYSHLCTLCPCEGLSAKGGVVEIITRLPGGRDRYGVIPIRGKGLNCREASFTQIIENEEISNLKKAIGLQEGVDYTIPANRKLLRYGRMLMMADSDYDGDHICGLMILFLYVLHPTVLAEPFFYMWTTPIIRATKGKDSLDFFNESDFNQWKANTPDWESWKPRYYKGLGSSSKAEIVKDLSKLRRTVACFYDANTPYALDLAFKGDKTTERKKWINDWDPALGIQAMQYVSIQQWYEDNVQHVQIWKSISHFILYDFIGFCIANMQRSLPGYDGLKPGQRKLLEWVIRRFNVGPLDKTYEPVNVGTIANECIAKMKYHHGPDSMVGTLYVMARDYVGSNNVPYFTQDGQMGTRNMGGKDAANSRYTSTRPHPLLPYIFRQEDNKILEYQYEENKKVEPKRFYPIAPPGVFNGMCGVGTAWSSFGVNHDLLDVIAAIRNMNKGIPAQPLKPWYRGYTGIIEVLAKTKKPDKMQKPQNFIHQDGSLTSEEKQILQDETTFIDNMNLNGQDRQNFVTAAANHLQEKFPISSFIPEGNSSRGRYRTMRTKGIFMMNSRGDILVTELPIGTWSFDYLDWLKDLISEKKINNYRNNSTTEVARFEIGGWTDEVGFKPLRLVANYGLSNMVVLDNNDKPRRFLDANEFLEVFYYERLDAYVRRQKKTIEEFQEKIKTLTDKMRYIMAVCDKVNPLIIINRWKAETFAEMDQRQLPHYLLDKVRGGSFSLDDVPKLQAEINQLYYQMEQYSQLSPQYIWNCELDQLEAAYCALYNVAPRVQSDIQFEIN